MSYTLAFETEYGVSFSDARTNCIADDTILSNFLLFDSRSTFVRYIHVTRFALNSDALSLLLEDLNVDGATSMILGTT